MITDQYIAGFFDGEGSISATPKARGFYLRVCITNTNRDVLLLVKEKFYGRIHTHNNPIGLPIHQWMADRKRALSFLKAVLPYLIVKAPQANVALEWESHMLGPGRWKGPGADAARAAIVDIRQRIMRLNSSSGWKRSVAKTINVHPVTENPGGGRWAGRVLEH